MKPELHRFGHARAPVVVLTGMSGALAEIRAIAASMAPFGPAEGTYYPGLRRAFTDADEAAFAYAERTLQAAAPYIGGAFDADGFDLVSASFSMVTTAPYALLPAQKAPHFDSTDPKYLAVLHYLSDTPGTGTAFYRQRSTGIEMVDDGNIDTFVGAAKRESLALTGYTNGSNEHFEQIGAIKGVPDRLIVYQGALLHSGIIPANLNFSGDPMQGRLTANFFIRAH